MLIIDAMGFRLGKFAGTWSTPVEFLVAGVGGIVAGTFAGAAIRRSRR